MCKVNSTASISKNGDALKQLSINTPKELTKAEQVQAGIHIRATEASVQQDLGMSCWVQNGLELELWRQLRDVAACALSLSTNPAHLP